MSSIQIDDHVLAALEASAAARGLSLSEYLAVVAASQAPSRALTFGTERSLAELVAPIIAEARRNQLAPRTPHDNAMHSGFDAVMVEKYRKQGFNL